MKRIHLNRIEKQAAFAGAEQAQSKLFSQEELGVRGDYTELDLPDPRTGTLVPPAGYGEAEPTPNQRWYMLAAYYRAWVHHPDADLAHRGLNYDEASQEANLSFQSSPEKRITELLQEKGPYRYLHTVIFPGSEEDKPEPVYRHTSRKKPAAVHVLSARGEAFCKLFHSALLAARSPDSEAIRQQKERGQLLRILLADAPKGLCELISGAHCDCYKCILTRKVVAELPRNAPVGLIP